MRVDQADVDGVAADADRLFQICRDHFVRRRAVMLKIFFVRKVGDVIGQEAKSVVAEARQHRQRRTEPEF